MRNLSTDIIDSIVEEDDESNKIDSIADEYKPPSDEHLGRILNNALNEVVGNDTNMIVNLRRKINEISQRYIGSRFDELKSVWPGHSK